MIHSGENTMHNASSRFSQKRESIHLVPMLDGRAAITLQIEETMWSQDATQQRNTSLDEIESDRNFDDDYTDPDFEDDFSVLNLNDDHTDDYDFVVFDDGWDDDGLDDDDSEAKDVSADGVTVSGIHSYKECRKQNRCASYLKRNATCTREGKLS